MTDDFDPLAAAVDEAGEPVYGCAVRRDLRSLAAFDRARPDRPSPEDVIARLRIDEAKR